MESGIRLLTEGELELEGRLLTASNATFVGRVTDGESSAACVYKPVRGERPLHDFPDGTLAGRERAAYLVSEAAGVSLVPPTVLRDGRFGPGMCQLWIDEDTDRLLVDVVPAQETPASWRHILDAEDQHRRPVSLVHADDPALRRMAVLDVVLNNADRKGGHVLVERDTGRLFGVDHGVCLHADPKLRTVLWGWAGEPLPEDGLELLQRVRRWVASEQAAELTDLLTGKEITAITDRIDELQSAGTFPVPRSDWRAIPWPAF